MKKQLIILSLFATAFTTYAQKEQEDIKKEDVVVEFSFNPTLSDVFKLKTSPNEAESFPKKQLTYQINSKGVPSDFVPIAKKVVYVNIDEPKPVNYYNYIYGAAGFYGNGEFELLLQPQKTKKDYEYGLSLTSYNSQNGIDNKKVDNGQWKIDLGLFLTKKGKNLDWRADVDYQNHMVHWYGLDANIPSATYQDQNVQQSYKDLKFSGTIDYKNSFVKTLTPSLQFFSDDYSSSEVNINFGTELSPSLLGDIIKAKIDFQYLNGSFNQSYESIDNINYSFLNIGVTPSYTYKTDVFRLTTALGLFVNNNKEASSAKFLALPKVQADVILVQDIMNLHGGIRSKMTQNSYASLAAENPFVSPTLNVETSYTPVDLFLGLDGALSKSIRYGLEGSYQTIKNQALYLHNAQPAVLDQAFTMGNSFKVVYDDLNILSVKANVEVDFSKYVKAGGNVVFNTFDPKNQEKAWNMSGIEMETYLNYHQDKFFSQFGINIVDGRYSMTTTNEAKKLDGFLDMNLKLGYKINQKLNAHVNLYNMLSNKYQLYRNYGVQGVQAVVGLSYKF
ncbi:hypothetical protein AXE80_00130 [Wenyingzhuangia fucanilytica]|uniref:TonB-dependent receptor n=1 Tax=Wenyingzhuangia fucanilytica TaxID=1790137 RepID=A0A1B1Y200_9FLAO|nr:hypothetical protein [Wenyingzhuangia fucanilytica]ANW94794.1 hypothetical protein AXE80_00130 [Wenyingzhuangia fucanilytica]